MSAEEAALAQESIAILTVFVRVDPTLARSKMTAYRESDIVFVESERGLWTLYKNRWGDKGKVFDADAKRDFLNKVAVDHMRLPESWQSCERSKLIGAKIRLLEIPYGVKV